MKKLLLFIFLLALAVSIHAQSKPDLITELLKTKRTIKRLQDRLSGDGLKFLTDEAGGAQFFLIGEDHGIADMPEFTGLFFRELNRVAGYDTFATETGPLTAKYLEKMARDPRAGALIEGFNKQYPLGIPFYFWREEVDMAGSIAKTARNSSPIFWGLDQEFMTSPAFHFKRLVELAPNKNARALANEYYSKVKDEVNRVIAARNPGVAFLSSATGDDFDKLEAAFKTANAEARKIIAELRDSREIYGKNLTDQNYESNLQRSQMMKRHFMEYYNEALRLRRSPPKILFKFGANHMKRGRNTTNVHDIGNFAAELAQSTGSSSFHLLVIPLGGTKNSYLPFLDNVADKQKKIVSGENSSPLDARPFLELARDSDDWIVIDLRPIRPLIQNRRLTELPRGIADLVWAHDAILIMPKVRAATLIE